MRVVIQRVTKASVKIDNNIKSSIGCGLLILLGVTNSDSEEDSIWLSNKIAKLRIFEDHEGVMNNSILDIDGEIIVVSQFTLMAKTKKGNRPSYTEAARPDIAIPLYKHFVTALSKLLGKEVLTGEFGANMDVALHNDGPVTIIMDSKNKE